MDRLKAARRQARGWVLFGALLVGFILVKSFHDGWFEPRTPLPLDGKPALVFFTLGAGCECQMSVVRAAEAQLDGWDVPAETGIPLLRVDFSRRPDLAKQYRIIRAPALALLDADGQVVWKQDLGRSDTQPLDLAEAARQMETLLVGLKSSGSRRGIGRHDVDRYL
jgi:hypothetical protein